MTVVLAGDRALVRNPLMLADDLRHAWRRLRAQPGTAAVAASMLALAIGVTSATFTVVDHMLFRPAPFRDPSRLVTPWIGQDDPLELLRAE